jgi:hypothetical protein
MGEEEYAFRECYMEAVNTRQKVHDFFENLWVPNCEKLGLPAWDEFMVFTNNQNVPVFTPAQYVDFYFGVDYDHPRKGNMADEDLAFHRNFFRKQYEDYSLPDLKAKNVPVPTPMAMDELKRKMVEEASKDGFPGN